MWARAANGAGTETLKTFAERAKTMTQALAIVYMFRENVCELTVCLGPSMMPTFNPKGDVALVEHLSVTFERLERGDVVISKSVQNPKQTVCKRVLGFAGETISVPSSTPGGTKTVTIPPGHVWLQGDNTFNSTDSRHYGPVPYAMLKGRVVAKIWPMWPKWIDRDIPKNAL